jgi:hypothetical protein
LLQIANNYETMGKQVALYTAAIDDRFGVGMISSRLGIQRQATLPVMPISCHWAGRHQLHPAGRSPIPDSRYASCTGWPTPAISR